MTPSEPPSEPPAELWAAPRRTHPASPWLSLVAPRGPGGLVLFLLLLGNRWAAAAIGAIAVVGALLTWWRRTWSFDGSMLTLDDGVFRRTYRRVPVGRVQQVEVHEPFVHRLLGHAVVRIETAGGGGTAELVLDALPRREAAAISEAVLAARARVRLDAAEVGPSEAGVDGAAIPAPPDVTVLRLDTQRILLSGVLGSNLLVVFAVLGGFYDVVSRLPRQVGELVESEATQVATSLGLLLGAVVLLALALVIAAIAAVVAHHDLTVVRSHDELRMRRGLLERRDAVVPLARVQAVTISQNPAQRLVGLHAISVRSAGTSSGDDVRLSVPAVSLDEVARLLQAALGRSVDLADLVPAPPAARTRRILRRLATLVVPLAALAAATSFSAPALAAVGVAGIVAVVTGLDAYRSLGHRLDPDVLVTRSGFLLRRTVVVVRARTQSTRTRATVFQRRRDLATLAVDLAGRGATPAVVDQRTDRALTLAGSIEVVADSSPGEPYATLGARSLPSNEES